MNDRPGWIRLLYERHTAWRALHTAFLLNSFKGFVSEEADARPNGRGQLREVALAELNSPDPQCVAISLLFLGIVGQLSDMPAVEAFVTHESDLVQRASRASLFQLKQNGKSANLSED